MSNKQFCPVCYKPTPYESSAPTFCSHCGKSFINGIESTTASKPQQRQNPKSIPQTRYEPIVEDEEIINVPNIDKIEFEIINNLRPSSEKIESLAGTRKKPQPLRNAKNKKANPLSKQELEKTWLQQFPKNGKNNSTDIEGN